MIKKIFIGGHYSSGSRVIQYLLEQTHNIYNTNIQKDYELGFSDRDNTFVEKYLRKENPEWEGEIEPPFSIKNPDLMLAIPQIRKLFPQAKFILVVRHGIDQVLCENRCMIGRFEKFFRMKQKGYFEREMEFWNKAYKKAIKDRPDMIVRLEDLVYNTKKTVEILRAFLKISYPNTSMIKKPASMGSYKDFGVLDKRYASSGCMIPPGLEYNQNVKEKLYKIGEDMMRYFNYAI
ncbi:MAG: sulfotransferase [Nanoarchaeota archaeon]